MKRKGRRGKKKTILSGGWGTKKLLAIYFYVNLGNLQICPCGFFHHDI
jgi:hypothetical protein